MAKSFYAAFSEQMDRLQSSVESIYKGAGPAGEIEGPAAGPQAPSRSLSIDSLSPGRYQPRRTFEETELRELADSIHQQGLIQPVVVRPLDEDGRYEILAGERRWRACKLLGRDSIEVIVKDVGDQSAVAMSLIENIQRENLNPMEEAEGYQRLISEFGLKQSEVGELVGKSRSRISRLLSLISLPDQIKNLVREESLSGAHGIVLAASGLDEAENAEFASLAIRRDWSRDQLEKAIQKARSPREEPSAEPDVAEAPVASETPEAPEWSERFQEALQSAGEESGQQLSARFDPETQTGVIEVALSADSVEAFEEAALKTIHSLRPASPRENRPWRRRDILRRRQF